MKRDLRNRFRQSPVGFTTLRRISLGVFDNAALQTLVFGC
jgi:hypothetical protein